MTSVQRSKSRKLTVISNYCFTMNISAKTSFGSWCCVLDKRKYTSRQPELSWVLNIRTRTISSFVPGKHIFWGARELSLTGGNGRKRLRQEKIFFFSIESQEKVEIIILYYNALCKGGNQLFHKQGTQLGFFLLKFQHI